MYGATTQKKRRKHARAGARGGRTSAGCSRERCHPEQSTTRVFLFQKWRRTRPFLPGCCAGWSTARHDRGRLEVRAPSHSMVDRARWSLLQLPWGGRGGGPEAGETGGGAPPKFHPGCANAPSGAIRHRSLVYRKQAAAVRRSSEKWTLEREPERESRSRSPQTGGFPSRRRAVTKA